MVAGGRHETPGSETRDVMTRRTASSMGLSLCWLLFAPTSTRAGQWAQTEAGARDGLHER